jgi:hypothetical protein
VGEKLVRIELTKHYQPHHEIEELEEDAEADASITIEIENDYQQLRTYQNGQIKKSFGKMSQKDDKSLV